MLVQNGWGVISFPLQRAGGRRWIHPLIYKVVILWPPLLQNLSRRTI